MAGGEHYLVMNLVTEQLLNVYVERSYEPDLGLWINFAIPSPPTSQDHADLNLIKDLMEKKGVIHVTAPINHTQQVFFNSRHVSDLGGNNGLSTAPTVSRRTKPVKLLPQKRHKPSNCDLCLAQPGCGKIQGHQPRRTNGMLRIHRRLSQKCPRAIYSGRPL